MKREEVRGEWGGEEESFGPFKIILPISSLSLSKDGKKQKLLQKHHTFHKENGFFICAKTDAQTHSNENLMFM